MQINYKNKQISIPAIKKVSGFGIFRGLMFCRRKNCPALLFEFKKPTELKIHSLFVFFPFLALWLDDKNKIIEKRIVKPWKLSVSPGKSFNKLIEVPFSTKYSKTIASLVGS